MLCMQAGQVNDKGERTAMEKGKLLSLLRRRKSHLLQRVTDKFLRRLSDMCAEDGMLMAENQKVMKEGDDCDPPYLWIVCQGKVDISVKGGMLTSVGPGGLVGEFSVVTGLRRRADAFAKEQAVLIKVSADVVRSLTPENRDFLPQLAAEQEALAAFFQEMYPDVSVPHAEVGICPAQVHMPPMAKFLTEKAAGITSFADNVAAYKRLLRLAIKAKVGTGNLFLFFAPDNHSPHVQLDPYGERASKVKPEGSLLFPSAEGLWGSTMVLPAIDKPAMVFVEFKIENYNPVCELLIGVCDGSQKPASGQVIFKRDNAWMYYCHTGRRYSKGVGYDLSSTTISGKTVGHGDCVGILIDQSPSLTLDSRGNQGRCAAVYVNGHLQGELMTERQLEKEGKSFPQQLMLAVDMYGENLSVTLLPERTRVMGVDLQAQGFGRHAQTMLPAFI